MQLNPERQLMSSCCIAMPEKINIQWLKNNTGKLFNTDTLVNERSQMLENIPVASCNECWNANDQGVPSRQIRFNGQEKTDSTLISSPKVLEIKLGINCNLTCSYCDRYSSSSWLNDITTNGLYENNHAEGRFEVTSNDRLVVKLGQKSLANSNNYKLLINEAASYTSINQVIITGGEPFLFNNLLDIINKFQCQILIFTGLGVDSKRLVKFLDQLPKDRVRLAVSAENLDKRYEFNRYGNTYASFLKNVESINNSGIIFDFYSVVSNVTIFGLKDFLNKFQNLLGSNICVSPEYLAPYVIDPISREQILSTDYNKWTNEIHETVKKIPTEAIRMQAGKFITEFAKRRNLSLDIIFPSNFIDWLNTPEK